MHFVPALAGKVEGDAGDPLDLARGVDGRVDGALLAVFERHDLLRFAEIGAAGQLAQDQDIQPLDQLALQARRLGQRRIADRGAQVGEEIKLLAQLQQASFRADLVGHLVPFGPAHRAENDGVGRPRLAQHLVGQRHAVLVDRAAAAQPGFGGELGLAHLVEEGQHAIDFRHHLGADAVAREQEQLMGCHLDVEPLVVACASVAHGTTARFRQHFMG